MATARPQKLARCQMNHVAVRAKGYGREIGKDAVVDLNEVVGETIDPESGATVPVTLEDALGEHAQSFELVESSARTGRAARAAAPRRRARTVGPESGAPAPVAPEPPAADDSASE